MSVLCEITQFGKGILIGGWDKYGDSNSNKFIGNTNDPLINGVSCALSDSAKLALNVGHNDWLRITFDDGTVYIRQVRDRAPESNKRVDFFNYYAFDDQMDKRGMFAQVEKLILSV